MVIGLCRNPTETVYCPIALTNGAFRNLLIRFPLCLLVVGLPSLCAAVDLSPQLASIEAQRSSIQRQLSSTQTQMASAERQKQSVRYQETLLPVWKNPLPVVAAAATAVYDCEPIAANEAESLIHSAADKEALPPELLRAVVKQESGFKPCAVSSVGAQGLMQLMPATAVDLHVANPFDPKENLRGGAAYLKQLVTRYGGDLRKALGAYNAGMSRVDAFGGVPNFLETQNYVSSITGDLGYDQMPLLPAVEPEVIDDLPVAGREFHAASLQLSLGTVKFGLPKEKTVAVTLAP